MNRHLDGPPIDYASARKARFWTVGTLTYTTSGLMLLFFWLLFGDFALSMRERSVGPMVQLFLKQQQVSDTMTAVLLSSLPPALGIILGPIVSMRSDRMRGSWGRRIPFLLVPTPIAALAMVGIAFSGQMGAALQAFVGSAYTLAECTVVVFTVFWTIFEVAVIISGAVFGGLINDVVPRPVLGRFYGLFRAVSLIDGMIFNYFLLQHAEEHFELMFTLIAVVFGVGFVLMCLRVREGQYPPPPPSAEGGPFLRLWASIKVYFRECFLHPYYLLFIAATTMASLVARPFNLFSIYYAKQLNMDMGYYGKLIALSYLVSLVLAYPLGSMVDRFHALRMGIVSMALYAFAMAYGALFSVSADTFGIALVAHTVLSGMYFTTTASLGQAILPRSKFTQFASAGGLVNSIVSIGFGPAVGLALDFSGHNYRLTYQMGLVLTIVSLVLLYWLYRHFNRLGGRTAYVAPGDTEAEPAAQVRP
jgi:MFS family permease